MGTDRWAASVRPRSADDREVLAAQLWAAGAGGVWERPDELVAYFEHRRDDLAVGDPPLGPTWTHVPDEDWLETWRAHAVPVRAGRFEVVPRHLAARHETEAGLLRIVVDAGMAFGSGHHDTTAGCLEELGDDLAGARVLDLGTGSGILAIGAGLAGAGEVIGVDVDPAAIAVAGGNVAANGVAVALDVGSLVDVAGTFDLVLANLHTDLLVRLAHDLVVALRPGGRLVASGVGSARADEVTGALRDAGARDVHARPRGEWAIVTARRHS